MKKKFTLIVLLFSMCVSFGQTITTLWNYPMPSIVGQTTSPAIGTDGTVYIACSLTAGQRVVGNTTPNFFAINPGLVSNGGGTLKWNAQITESPLVPASEKPDDITTTPAVHPDGSIYMGGIFCRAVFKLNPLTGGRTAVLNSGLGRQRQNSFAFSPDGTAVYTGFYSTASNRGIKSLKSDLSAKNWDFEIDKEFNLVPAVAADGTIYAASITTATDRFLYAINPDGTQKWAVPYCVGAAGYMASAIAIAPDGTIYLSAKLTATPDGVLKAYNPVDGSEKWSTTIAGANVERGGPAIGPDGTIYLGNSGGFMRSYSPVTGAQINTFTASGAIQVVPAIDNDGKIYFGTTTGNFYVLNSDLTLAYTMLDLGDSIHSAAVIGADGTIYIASNTGTGVNSGKLYALQTTATGPASSHWPMYGKTALHTSNARHTWTGSTSTAWSLASNWDLAVPITGNDVAIPVGITNQPTIASNVTINSLLVGTGNTLSVNPGNTLNVSNTIANSGDLILSSSAVGTANLLSDSSASNVTQQRYLASNQRGWRLLSNPLGTTTFGTLATNSTTPITLGNNASGAYNSATNTWTSTTDADNMVSQQGYKVFLRGRTSEVTTTTYSATPPSNVTLAIKGTATNTVPTAISTNASQYYLVANPYTAPVSLYSILGASTGLSNTVSYYNPTVGSSGSNADLILKYGGYATTVISAATQGDANDVILPPMGAIFVQASSSGTINIPKTAIFTGPILGGNYNHKTAIAKATANNQLKLNLTSNGTYYDTVTLQFKEAGGASSNIDFGKLPNSVLDFYSIDGGNNMAVSELELAAQTIPLGITSTVQKSYTLNVVQNTIPSGFEAELKDNYLDSTTVLAPGSNYNFTIDSNPASQGNGRFAINLKTAATLSVEKNELDSTIKLWPNPAHNQFNILNSNEGTSSIEISNLNGQVIHSQKLNSGTTTIQTNNWAAGVYILKATNNGTQTIKKFIIQ
jgi:Secretion system C-terminal sorting domain/PQQ-like domain